MEGDVMSIRNEKQFKYKIGMAILFGIIGFFANFFAFEIFETNGLLINLLPGLFFPLIISLSWGWKYGLISALFGGCQTMWIIWHYDGYGLFYSVPVLVISWIPANT